jgi:trans-aconitate 2-methyltransferase
VSAPPLTPLAAALLRVPVPERALVVCCGDGEAALLLAREFPAARVRGVDPSPELVRAASARVGLDPEGRVAFKVGRPGALPYPDAFFDLIAQVDCRPVPAEISRALRPGAHLILAGPARAGRVAAAGERLLRRRLRRHGITPVEAGSIGDGNFFVGRLGDAGRTSADI